MTATLIVGYQVRTDDGDLRDAEYRQDVTDTLAEALAEGVRESEAHEALIDSAACRLALEPTFARFTFARVE